MIESQAGVRRPPLPPTEGAPDPVGDAAPGRRARRAQCDYRQTDTYGEVLRAYDEPLDVVQPTSWAALHFVDRLAETIDLDRLPARGYATSRADFARWAESAATVGGC